MQEKSNRKFQFNQTKLLPRNEDYEKNILGNCILRPSIIDKYGITGEFFYEARDKIIFNSILDMRKKGQPIGDLELREYLTQKKLIEKVGGGFFYIGSLTDNAIRGNIKTEVQRLRQAANLRRLWELAHRLIQAIERETT